MAQHIVRQPVEVISQGGCIHFVNAGFCLGCNETATYIEENGQHMATIRPGADGIAYLDVEIH